ncbi:hypothetical protein I302_102006 [Kwoniella bestiolae CBS 10118]|uniref:methylated diphthine methylhydrolase n=1 Tax=Kwoniella bestiolae CBS 10118 TaxID=1296100 RepID=A0A1B9GDW1_9TREE|nr:WD40 repeat domain 85 [Kwoniella bestiolae CBS 10118]OCF29194.1 WD40 repeat domain 85 [Kwoniella bestiolae CBS 10118]
MAVYLAKSLAYVDTVYSADSIEWCPFNGYQDIFVCGTYQIVKPEDEETPALQNSDKKGNEEGEEDDDDEDIDAGPSKPTQRVGRLLLYQVGEDDSLTEIQRVETPAILDTKWSPKLDNGNPVLGVADAKGHITLYALDTDTKRLSEIHRIDVDEESTLCLSLDWSNRLNDSSPSSIITSLSTGNLSHITPTPTGWEVDSTWKAHDYEPWITSFDNWDSNTVWSGGDDCKLKRWDIRETFRPTFVNKNFDAGVTTIASSPHTEHLLAVGSYDEILRIFDTRSPLTPLTTIHLGGGIWRTKFHPSSERKKHILNACMHDNFKIVNLPNSIINLQSSSNSDEGRGEIITTFEDHESLAYGVDWSRLPSDSCGETLVASCSFYDHAMHLWRG